MPRRTGTTPGSAPQHFVGYDVLAEADTWDDVTREVVLARLEPSPPLAFFGPDEAPTARALVDRLLAQDDEPRVPVLEAIDRRLAERRTDGYRYDGMPQDWDAWRLSVAGLDADARARQGRPFWDLASSTQKELIERVQQLDDDWHGLPSSRVFALWVRYACEAFYSHPWAWNEIGFGGPAYPRGYANLGLDKVEHWEVRSQDAFDPIPWVEQAEAARRRHAGTVPPAPDRGVPDT